MNRVLEPRRENDARKPLKGVQPDDGGSSRGGLRKVLLGLGFAGLAYLAARRARRSEGTPSMGEVKETVSEVRSGDAFEIPIGDTGAESEDETETHEGTGTTEGAIGHEPMPGEDLSSGGTGEQAAAEEEDAFDSDASGDAATDQDVSGEAAPDQDESDQELSDVTMEGRAEENAHEEPTEPGEMAVDEEIAEDVIDDESDETEAGAGEVETGEVDEGEAEDDDVETGETEEDQAEAGDTGESEAEDEDEDEESA